MTVTLRERLNRLKLETEALKKMELELKQVPADPNINPPDVVDASVFHGVEPSPLLSTADHIQAFAGSLNSPTSPRGSQEPIEPSALTFDVGDAEIEKTPFDSSPSSASASFEYLGDSPLLRNSFPAPEWTNERKELFTWSVPGFVGSEMFSNVINKKNKAQSHGPAEKLGAIDQTERLESNKAVSPARDSQDRLTNGFNEKFDSTLRGWDLDASSDDQQSDDSSSFGQVTAVELQTIRRPEAGVQLAEAVKALITPSKRPMIPREITIPESDDEGDYSLCTAIEDKLAQVLQSPALRRHCNGTSQFCKKPDLMMHPAVSSPARHQEWVPPISSPKSLKNMCTQSAIPYRPSVPSSPVMSTGVGRVEIPPSPVECRFNTVGHKFDACQSHAIRLPNSPTAALKHLRTKAVRESENRSAKIRVMLASVLDSKPAYYGALTPPLPDPHDSVTTWTRTASWGGAVKKAIVGKPADRIASPSPQRSLAWGVKGNRQSMATAISQTCLPGEVNRSSRDKVIEAMRAEEKVERWVALLSDAGIFKALYRVESGETAIKVVEVRSSPQCIRKEMVKRSFRFETSSKQFKRAVDNKAPCFDNVTDAVSISLNYSVFCAFNLTFLLCTIRFQA